MIITLPITILIEGAVLLIYCAWWKKPLYPILGTSVVGNLITQPFLWMALNIFFRYYLAALLITEVLIWAAEGIFLVRVSMNRLPVREALLLSLVMNMASFGTGVLLPV